MSNFEKNNELDLYDRGDMLASIVPVLNDMQGILEEMSIGVVSEEFNDSSITIIRENVFIVSYPGELTFTTNFGTGVNFPQKLLNLQTGLVATVPYLSGAYKLIDPCKTTVLNFLGTGRVIQF